MLAIQGGTPIRTEKYPAWPRVTDADRSILSAVVLEGEMHSGKYRRAFEERFAADCGVKHCFAVANGTVSLELILRAYGIGAGDEVILPPYTFVATLSSIVFAGATPVFADIARGNYLLDPRVLEEKITPRTRAVVAVAVAGCPPMLDELEEICRRHGVRLIVDAAQAVGAAWRDRRICACGDVASISCQNTKNLTCGEGGLITTNDDVLAEKLACILGGGAKDGVYITVGQDHGISEYQAAILTSQYGKLGGEILLREKNAAYLAGRLKELDFVKSASYDPRITCHAFHLYLMRFEREVLAERGITRRQFLKAMNAEGIPVSAGYMPLYTFPCTVSADTVRMIGGHIDVTPLPECQRASYEEGAWLTQNLLLGTRKDIDDIADAMIKVWAHADDVRRL
ncbi:MAG: aminotransferase class V-fold PLP-dependent enzyme [Clostridia bacterium]|nr:aminotransferase class V-fold PLP-dependent enzyme [Clostridia bacterium]